MRQFEIKGRVLAFFLLVALSGAGFAQSSTPRPWAGAPGVTETIGQIMAREQQHPPGTNRPPRQLKPRLMADQGPLPQNPDSPVVPCWPPPSAAAVTQLSTATGPLAPQTVGTSFLGAQLSDTPGFVPPDSMGDVGPNQIVVCVNGLIRTFTRAGAADGALNATTDNFFNSVRGGSGTSDPRVRYDRLTGRWFITMITVNTPNLILIAVSSGPQITSSASFTFFQFEHDLVGTTPNSDTGYFADYDTLGVDANALYIGVNVFRVNSFQNTTGFVVKKANLLTGTLTVTAFRQLITGPGINKHGPYTPQGVGNDDPGATEGYFIGVDYSSGGALMLRRVSNPGGTPSISGNLSVTVPSTTNPMGGVPALGSTSNLDDLDRRLFAARMHNGSLWTAHNIEVDATGAANSTGSRDGGRWYELINLTGTPALRQSGTVFDSAASNPRSFWIPSCAMSGQGHTAFGSSVAGANEHAEIATAGRLAADVLGTMQAPTTAVTSASTYNVNDQSNPHRWGDYSVVTVDPNDDMTFWTVQEYCNANDSWGVRVIQLKAPPPATPASASPSVVTQGVVNVNVVVAGTSSNGSGFFDPGASFSNHISALVNGGSVTVNSVTYNNATNITLNLTVVSGAALGARTITVTNPDAQTATSATGILTIQSASPPQLVVQPGNLNYGTVIVGQTSNQTFSVINTGQSTLSGTATTAAPFAVVSGSPYSVAVGQTSAVVASFSPLAAGNFSNTVVFSSNGGTSSNAVTGGAITPAQLTVSPASHDFGTLATGTTAQTAFVVTNTGGATLTGTASVGGGVFAIISGGSYSVAGFGSTNVVVSFTPPSVASFSTNVIFASNGGNSTNAVTGSGAVPALASFSGSPTNGTAPLAVTFTDASTGTITNRFWSFGDGATSNTTATTVAHTYLATGTNSVSLTVSGPLGTNTFVRANYIVVTNIVPQADLALTNSATPSPVFAGQPLTYTLTVSNLGFAAAASVTVTDTLPAGVAFGSASTSQGTCTNLGGTVACNLDTLGANSNALVSLVVTSAVPGILTNSATVFTATVDPNLSNNTSSAVTLINPPADLSITATSSPNPVLTSQNLTYALTVANTGPGPASSVTVTDALPASVAFVGAGTSQGACTNIGGVVSCALGSLGSNAVATVTITVTPSAASNITTIVNTATVTASEFDPALSNNAATAVTTVYLDSIGDGVPNWWRAQFFGGDGSTTNGQSCAACDPDGDGQVNAGEYLAGTVPTNSNSALNITAITPEADDIRVVWTTVGGKRYVLQTNAPLPDGSYTNNFSDFSVILSIPGVGESTTNCLDLGGATNAPVRYYRVRLVP